MFEWDVKFKFNRPTHLIVVLQVKEAWKLIRKPFARDWTSLFWRATIGAPLAGDCYGASR